MTEPHVGRLQDARKADGLHLSPRHREKLAALLREHLPGVEVWAYGGRVNGRSHDGSDLDLVLRGPGLQAVPLEQLGDFTDAVRESTLPFLVEARDWTRLPARFHAEVERSYVALQHGAADTHPAADEWPAVTLGDCAVINDSTYSPKEAWPFIHYLDTGNVTDNRIAAIRRLVPGTDTIPSRARRKVQPGDVVYSTVRPDQRHFGLLKDPPDNLLVSTAFAVIRGKAGVAHTDFLYWFLAQRHVVERLHTIAEHSVSAYPSIRPDDLARLELRLPPLPEQRRIAHVLGTLDDKIALNRRLNATLEDMARALFKSWFVDFDPVHAKAALKRHARPHHSPLTEVFENCFGVLERVYEAVAGDPPSQPPAPATPPHPSTRSGAGGSDETGTATWTVERARAYFDGMDPEVAALFPDGFEDSEVGAIPAGWRIGRLADIAVAPRRGVDPTDLSNETPYIGLEHMPRRSIALDEWESAGKVLSNKTAFEQGDFLFGKLRPYFHKVGIAPVSGICSTDVIVITPKVAEWSNFVLALISSDEFVANMNQDSTGTRMPRTSWDTMSHYRHCRPTKTAVRAFQDKTQPLLSRIIADIHKNRALSTIRDTLLPKLLSGELRLRDAEKRMEGVV